MLYAQNPIVSALTPQNFLQYPITPPVTATYTPKPDLDESQLVADYLSACALVAHAEEKKEAAKQAILGSGLQVLRGVLNKLTVTTVNGRVSTDIKAMLQDGLFTEEQLSKYQKAGASSTRIYVSALS